MSFGIGTTPEDMAKRKARADALAGKPPQPSDAWSVSLRIVYRDAYKRSKKEKNDLEK